LVGEPGRPIDPWLGALSLGTWAEETQGPLAAYLVGKNLATRGHYAKAAQWLDRSLAGTLPAPSIARELLRQRAICACALGDEPAVERVKKLVEAPDSPFEHSPGGGRKDSVLRLLARCADIPRP